VTARQESARSPYQAALGDELDGLHPQLRAYFSAIPSGHHGLGRGVFDSVGMPRGWLWPGIAVLAPVGVVFPVWERDVPFTVVNRPVANGTRPGVTADRYFELARGGRHMRDLLSADESGLRDRLGSPPRRDTRLEAAVVDGALRLRSTQVTFLAGFLRIPFPRLRLAPTSTAS
jgi:hypothetical protein